MISLRFKPTMIAILAAWLAASCTPPATPSTPAPPPVIAKPTRQPAARPVNTKPVKTSRPAATAVPREEPINLQWKIDTGDIAYLGAAQDGTLYGFTRADSRTGLKYVVISPKGEVVKLLDMPEAHVCATSHREDFRDRQAYTVLLDGTLFCHKSGESTLLRIAPDGTATLTEPWTGYIFATGANTFFVNNDGVLRFYDLTGKLLNEVPLPDDWRNTTRQYFIDGQEFVYLTNDGQSIRFPLPEGFNPREKFLAEVLPWNDFYLTYRVYDAIGNAKGDRTLQVKPDGTVTTMDKNPWAKRYEGAYVPLPYVFYAPDREDVYAIEDVNYWHKLARINRDNKTLKVYEFSKEVNLSDAFVGNDGAVYVWGNSPQGKPQLSKYTLTR